MLFSDVGELTDSWKIDMQDLVLLTISDKSGASSDSSIPAVSVFNIYCQDIIHKLMIHYESVFPNLSTWGVWDPPNLVPKF